MEFLRLLAQYRTPALDTFFQLTTYLAQETLVVIFICWLYWCSNKKLAYTLGFSYFFSGLLIQGLKITFRIPRPWVLDPEFSPVSSALSGATGYSFPSGHTQSGTALFSTLGFAAKKRWISILCFCLMGLIGFSRMYLGVHTPKDVLVSMGLTLVLSFLIFRIPSNFLMDSKKAPTISLTLFLASGALLVYGSILYWNHIADPEMAADALKAAGAGLGFALGFYLERRFLDFSTPSSRKEKGMRFTVGLLSVALLMGIFELTIKNFLIGDIIAYFLLILWIVALYPLIFTRYEARKTLKKPVA